MEMVLELEWIYFCPATSPGRDGLLMVVALVVWVCACVALEYQNPHTCASCCWSIHALISIIATINLNNKSAFVSSADVLSSFTALRLGWGIRTKYGEKFAVAKIASGREFSRSAAGGMHLLMWIFSERRPLTKEISRACVRAGMAIWESRRRKTGVIV